MTIIFLIVIAIVIGFVAYQLYPIMQIIFDDWGNPDFLPPKERKEK